MKLLNFTPYSSVKVFMWNFNNGQTGDVVINHELNFLFRCKYAIISYRNIHMLIPNPVGVESMY